MNSSLPPADDLLRFVIASDGHLGEPDTDSRRFLAEFVEAVNGLHESSPLAFAVINGDIGHGGVALLREAKGGLDRLAMPYYVTQGNHDEVSASAWEEVWGTPGDQVVRIGHRSLLLANTSNEAGDYLCVDKDWLAGALASERDQQDLLAFLHITPATWTRHGIACPGVRRMLASAGNLRAVFNGHDHDQAGLKEDQGVSYLFDAHYGGHWGTADRAFRLVELNGNQLRTWLVPVGGEPGERLLLTW